MLTIIKNDWKRMWEIKGALILAVCLTIISVAAAILLTNKAVVKGNIAVVGESKANLDSHYFDVTYLKKKPAESKLIQNRYDAVITMKKDGSFTIDTIKSDDLRNELENAIQNPEAFQDTKMQSERRIGTNIFGYMMMFLLMQGSLYARLFAEDKEKHVAERILVSPIPFHNYIFGHGIFMTSLIFIPSFLVVAVASIFGIDIGFSLLQYAVLIGVLSLLSTAFALFVNSFFNVSDTANMICNSVVVLTSVLGGSFYSVTKESSIFNKLLHFLPQKDLLAFADAWEKNSMTNMKQYELIYVILLIVVLLAIAVLRTRREYIYSRSE
ncbi:ABC-type MDR transport system, permease component [Lachnospiraceae bacterium KM106-2]|nr:ABC-type MDR transport system, permease component [Lachnospiraceae bacterium KM106-2]